ncbi:MAG TPA: radical SAM protein [Terriglobia bacterium]|nr:radical SAM protein [Terriglobia bacterium]
MLPAPASAPPPSPGTAPRVGMARLAASSPPLAAKRKVTYFRLPVHALLNRCPNPNLPFRWTINPYRGCEFGCKYCYARYTHEYLGFEDPAAFEEKIYSKAQAGEILRRELRRDPGGAIAIGAATDPYQPAERIYGTTRSILETIAEFRGLSVSLTTKSDLVMRDVALLREIAADNHLQINMTIVTLDPALARKLEPRAPRPDLRLAAVRALSAAGLRVAIFSMPVLPFLTDAPANLEAVARAGAAAGAQTFAANALFLMPASQKAFFPFLEEQFPHLVARYRRWFRRDAYLRGDYAERIHELAQQLRKKYFPPPFTAGPARAPFGRRQQLALFPDGEASDYPD